MKPIPEFVIRLHVPLARVAASGRPQHRDPLCKISHSPFRICLLFDMMRQLPRTSVSASEIRG